MKKSLLIGIAAIAAVAGTPASATVGTYSLSVADPAAGLGSGPYGTVTVTENGDGTLTFVETLLNNFRIHGGNDNHDAFAFTISSDPNLVVTDLTAGFTTEQLTSGTGQSEPPFGTFQTAIVCGSACGTGYNGGFSGELTFTLGRTDATALTLASLSSNTYMGQQIYFTSDLVNSGGFTGNVGATLVNTPSVPEPATWAMMLIGFGATGVAMRRSRGSRPGITQFA